MILEIGIDETEVTLNQLLSQVEQGEEVTITRQGEPVARLLPIQKTSRPLASRIELREAQPLQKESSLETLQSLRHEARY
ncbi:MAG: type II toxin-antitoxin system prevent-host-death family antitoxin [Cyanobacteria bacterium P01_F01_bin.143]